jgi:hypothetical protein
METKAQRSIEFRYAVSLLAILALFVIANCWDYVRYSKLIAAYDVIVTFGWPFVMVFKGGATVVRPEIVWNGVAAMRSCFYGSQVSWLGYGTRLCPDEFCFAGSRRFPPDAYGSRDGETVGAGKGERTPEPVGYQSGYSHTRIGRKRTPMRGPASPGAYTLQTERR